VDFDPQRLAVWGLEEVRMIARPLLALLRAVWIQGC
jgi:hypothetical protein